MIKQAQYLLIEGDDDSPAQEATLQLRIKTLLDSLPLRDEEEASTIRTHSPELRLLIEPVGGDWDQFPKCLFRDLSGKAEDFLMVKELALVCLWLLF